MRYAWNLVAVMTLGALLVSACTADPNGGAATEPASTAGPSNEAAEPSETPPMSSIPPPILGGGSGPPKSPTDLQPDWIAGRVIVGGSGPCYRLETDDGTQYELYNADGITLETGTVARVQVEPLLIRISCGPGPHLHMLKAEKVG